MKTRGWIVVLVALLACADRREASHAASPEDMHKGDGDDGKMRKKELAVGGAMRDEAPPPPPSAAPVAMAEPAPEKAMEESDELGARADDERGAQSRSWFPETFLFEPLVVTDAQGAGKVSVRVPDRLTTYRVLALAHSRDGAQAGAEASFLGTLATYIDPVVPAFLMTGDEIRLPIQVVNTGATAVTGDLTVSAEGGTVAGIPGKVTVPASGSLVQTATLRASRPGTISLRAAFGSTDAVVRTIPVSPTGRKVTLARSGTLAAPRAVTLDGPAAADPASAEIRLEVYPGALGLLRTELAGSRLRGGVAEDAYTLLLAGNAPRLLAAFGDKADPDAVRELSLLAGQRVIRHGRNLDVVSAALILPSAAAHPDNAVLARLAERAASTLASVQRPDGSFGGADGWTLQRLLVQTAEATRAVGLLAASDEGKRRAAGVALRAQGVFERQAERIEDGYTAAAIVASGAVTGELADKLRDKVRAAIKPQDDGARRLIVDEGVLRSDGAMPSPVEATAVAVLALIGAGKPGDVELLADLGTTLLSSYDPRWGWGDGRANLACMMAVLALFKDPVPVGVKVTLSVDGKPLTDGVFDRAKLRDVLILRGAAPVGRHEWKIEATPPVPGLAYALTLVGYVPWEKQEPRGLELLVAVPADLRAARPATVTLTAAAPSGMGLKIHQSLPAGVQVDGASLDALVDEGTLSSWHGADGTLDLVVPELDPGETFKAGYKVIPGLAGTLHAGAASLEAAGERYDVPPVVWTVKP